MYLYGLRALQQLQRIWRSPEPSLHRECPHLGLWSPTAQCTCVPQTLPLRPLHGHLPSSSWLCGHSMDAHASNTGANSTTSVSVNQSRCQEGIPQPRNFPWEKKRFRRTPAIFATSPRALLATVDTCCLGYCGPLQSSPRLTSSDAAAPRLGNCTHCDTQSLHPTSTCTWRPFLHRH